MHREVLTMNTIDQSLINLGHGPRRPTAAFELPKRNLVASYLSTAISGNHPISVSFDDEDDCEDYFGPIGNNNDGYNDDGDDGDDDDGDDTHSFSFLDEKSLTELEDKLLSDDELTPNTTVTDAVDLGFVNNNSNHSAGHRRTESFVSNEDKFVNGFEREVCNGGAIKHANHEMNSSTNDNNNDNGKNDSFICMEAEDIMHDYSEKYLELMREGILPILLNDDCSNINDDKDNNNTESIGRIKSAAKATMTNNDSPHFPSLFYQVTFDESDDEKNRFGVEGEKQQQMNSDGHYNCHFFDLDLRKQLLRNDDGASTAVSTPLSNSHRQEPSSWLKDQLASCYDSTSSPASYNSPKKDESVHDQTTLRMEGQIATRKRVASSGNNDTTTSKRRNKSKNCIHVKKKIKKNFYANESTRHKHWSIEEDEKLKDEVNNCILRQGKEQQQESCSTSTTVADMSSRIDWERISNSFYNVRSVIQCKNRWYNHLQPGKVHGNWQQYEDEYIVSMVNRIGFGKWKKISECGLPHRLPNHIRARFVDRLDPQRKPKNTPWTDREDQILFEHQQRNGNEWAEISKELPGRTKNDIKNRFHNRMKALQAKRKGRQKQEMLW